MKNNSRRRTPGKRPNKATRAWIAPVFVAVVTCATFLPVLWNQFVEWDDYENLISNVHYRGLGWSQLRWMFTTFHMGHYQPLSWITFAVDYLLWGAEPYGYHLTNVFLHAANAVLFYFISRRLLSLALSTPYDRRDWRLDLSAAFAALLFAIHPLRVESVAWATERRDVLSGLFFLLTILCYLRSTSASIDAARSRRYLRAALAACALSLFSKATAITLPAILVILDIYPLARIEGNPRRWFTPNARKVLWEKIPFVVLAVPFGVLALLAQQKASALRTLESYNAITRLAQALVSANFYIWKSLIPVNLSPLHEIAPNFSAWNLSTLASAAGAILVFTCLFVLRNRWPAALACWVYYIVMLAPVMGIAQSGPQLVADRYSYLSCLSWDVLIGGTFLYFQRLSEQRLWQPSSLSVAAAAAVILIIFGSLSRKQIQIWRDTGTLWSYALSINSDSSIAHYNLARSLARQGKQTEAIEHYRQALKIRPQDPDAHNNLGLLLAMRGDIKAAIEEFGQAVENDPNYAKAFYNMGKVFARQGELEKATENYRQAMKLSPNEAEIRLGLGNVLARQGQLEAAAAQFEQATKLRPDFADAQLALAGSLAAQGKKDEAERQYQKAMQLLKSQNRSEN